jgi:putative pyrroloquinoline-quinone-binding quinoprotein
LKIKWIFPTKGDVYATPSVVNGIVYAGDTSGRFYALTSLGKRLWETKVNGPITASALVTDQMVIFGDQAGFEVIEAKTEQGLSAQRIYQDLVEQNGFTGSYESVKRFIRKLKNAQPQRVWRLEARPCEEVQIDFGLGAPIDDSGSRPRSSWVFRIQRSRASASPRPWWNGTLGELWLPATKHGPAGGSRAAGISR